MSTAKDFEELSGKLDPPMIVVTTVVDGQRAGCLVGFHTQCSVSPPRYAIWLSKANHTFSLGLYASHFGIHYLGSDDFAIAERFGTRCSDEVDKFEGLDLDDGPGGLPMLQGMHRIVGRKISMLDDGSDHTCIIVEAESVELLGPVDQLRLQSVAHLEPGHDLAERRSAVEDGGRLDVGS